MLDRISDKDYKTLFTEDEWDAIDSAMNDYADYGDNAAQIADNIQYKIAQLFKN